MFTLPCWPIFRLSGLRINTFRLVQTLSPWHGCRRLEFNVVHTLPPEHDEHPVPGAAHVFPSADRQSVASAHAVHTSPAHAPAAHFALSVHAEHVPAEEPASAMLDEALQYWPSAHVVTQPVPEMHCLGSEHAVHALPPEHN